MEYLQYKGLKTMWFSNLNSFKPYYKWNTFNTSAVKGLKTLGSLVLNLIINGIPSILTVCIL